LRLAAPTFASDLRRSPLASLAFLGLFISGAYIFAQYVITDNLTGLAYIGLACLGGTFVIAILNNWRNGLYFFLTWLLFEDFARKFLGNNMAIYFAKDVLVAVVYLSFFLEYRRKKVQTFRPAFRVPLLLFIWFGVMQIFNPASTTVLYGVLGMKLYFSYVPLLFLGYALINSESQLRKFFVVNIFLALIIGGLGIAQSITGPSFLNPAHPAEDIRELSTLYRTSPISGVSAYRASSVFVSAGRYTDFILIAWLLVLGYTGYLLLRHKRGRNLAFITVTAMYASIILGAARGLFMWGTGSAIVIAAAFIWGAPWKQREVMRVLRTVQRAALAIGLAVVALFFLFPDALASRLTIYSETLTPGSSASELQHRTWDYPVENFLKAFRYDRWPYGFGVGTSSLGVQYMAHTLGQIPMNVGVESGFGTLIVEMGVGGLTLWLIMSIAIVVSAWKVVKKLRGSPWFPIAFVIFWNAFILLLPITFTAMAMYQDFVVNAYLWLTLGILFRLPTLTLSAQFASSPAPAPQPGFLPQYRFRTR
jgi:hypothetical protein